MASTNNAMIRKPRYRQCTVTASERTRGHSGFQLAPDDYIAGRIDGMDLESRFSDI